MLRDALPCLRESSDIFARTRNTPSTRCGRDSPASRSVTVMNVDDVFPVTRAVAAPRASGPQITTYDGVVGYRSFHRSAPLPVPELATTDGSLRFQKAGLR